MAKKLNTGPSKRKVEDDEFYDYDAARKAGITRPDASGHWPSEFKKEGHPNLIVGGFNTKTGKRVPGTKQGTEAELRNSGWDAESAKRLGRVDVPKKPAYDVAERFKEVAKRAKEVGPINTGPSKKKPEPDQDRTAFYTRPGRHDPTLSPDEMTKIPLEKRHQALEQKRKAHKADVNLPVDTSPSNKKKKK